MLYKTIIYLLLSLLTSQSALPQLKSGSKLRISPNKRYFIDEKGKPFFWLGDTGWLLFSKLDREESEVYLEDRRLKGFNVIQVMLLHELKVVNAYGDSGLRNLNVATPKISPGQDYWDHVDHVIDLAARKGLYMALVPVWGGNVKAGGVSQIQAATYARWLANRYKNKPNIIWLNGGDIRGSDSMNTWKAMGREIRKADPNHLITFHPFGRTTSSDWFHNESWMDFNMFQSGHRSYDLDTSRKEYRFGPDNYKFVLIDYNKLPIKPTLDGEPSYEEIPYGLHDTTKPRWNDNDVRRYGYWGVFAGGAGYTYGHNSVMQMYKPGEKNTSFGPRAFWNDALNYPGAQQMVYLKKLMLSKPYFERVPDQSMIANQGVKYNYIAATRGKNYAFIYNYSGRPMKIVLGKLPGAKLKASWYSPRDGSTIKMGKFINKGEARFFPPGGEREGNDWVLVLETMK